MILSAASAGFSVGAILLILSHLAPRFGAGNFVRDLDQPRLFGRQVTRREAHLVGILVHLIFSGLFGALYGLFVILGIFQNFDLLPILIWSAVQVVFVGGIILPLEGHGIFGIKEDVWFPIDLIILSVSWGILFWFFIKLWIVTN